MRLQTRRSYAFTPKSPVIKVVLLRPLDHTKKTRKGIYRLVFFRVFSWFQY